MKVIFEPGDRVIQRNHFVMLGQPIERPGTFIAGPGKHPTERPGNSLVIGEGYALVQFDDGEPGQAQVVRLDSLKPEGQ